ncbi:MAG: hypothetical protein F4X62_12405 [Caldilineaceae bacterium SB0662_bin_25]|nr:hypothetical protein [Caldilineaceae bacterium SB0662_bin_25]
MDRRDLQLLVLVFAVHDPDMDSLDLAKKVAYARNLMMPSGRVNSWTPELAEEIAEAKSELREHGLLEYGPHQSSPHVLTQDGHDLMENLRHELYANILNT